MTSEIILFITESLFNDNIQAGFQQVKKEYGITDDTNLTTWDVQVSHLQIKTYKKKFILVHVSFCSLWVWIFLVR